MEMSHSAMDIVFGPGNPAETITERARQSLVRFVRSQDHLALYNENASGHVLTAWEAFDVFGFDVLETAVLEGASILPPNYHEPSRTFRMRREMLGLSPRDISRVTGLAEDAVRDAENPDKRSPIGDLEKIAQVMALDERKIAFQPGSNGDENLALRLRSINQRSPVFSGKTVLQLCEAAWVIEAQERLRRGIVSCGDSPIWKQKFPPNNNYGDPDYPAWLHGYYLARQARKILDLDHESPIENLRSICERLEIPLVQLELPAQIAGATLANGSSRGIAVNIQGNNQNVWVRRFTIAHELGHLLWDPQEELQKLSVDSYAELKKAPWDQHDFVEQRANAFAIEFLAPQSAVDKIFSSKQNRRVALRDVMEHFGISFTAARYHVWNAYDRTINLESLVVEDVDATDEWQGSESFTADWFPAPEIPIVRRGEFAGLVIKAQKQGLISDDTAARCLGCRKEIYRQVADDIQDIFSVGAGR